MFLEENRGRFKRGYICISRDVSMASFEAEVLIDTVYLHWFMSK